MRKTRDPALLGETRQRHTLMPSHTPQTAGAAGKSSRATGRKQQQMPMCDYGAACTRKGCIYRHPPKPKRDAASSQHSRGASMEEELALWASASLRLAIAASAAVVDGWAKMTPYR